MSISNYTELQTAVGNWLARSTLATRIPEFITLAESEMNYGSDRTDALRLRSMIETVNINPSTTETFVALPDGFLELIEFSDDLGEPLQEIGYEELEQRKYASAASRPEYFVIGARIDFERKVTASRDFPMRYYKRLDIESDLTNDTLTNNPNLYLFKTLEMASEYIMNDQRAQYWRRKYRVAAKSANTREARDHRKLRTDVSRGQRFDILRGW